MTEKKQPPCPHHHAQLRRPGLLWVVATMVGALHQANWQVSELARQYMLATGMDAADAHLVDFYSHIKGIEYLICVAFFVAFPVFFKYVNKEEARVTVSR